MDAKERLRVYLEQRRDAGESELVLDSLSVEEVMRLLGAGSASRMARSDVPSSPRPLSAERAVPLSPSSEFVDAPRGAPPADWRDALRALDPRTSHERPTGERAAAQRSAHERAAGEGPVHERAAAEGVAGDRASADRSSEASRDDRATAKRVAPRSDAERAPTPSAATPPATATRSTEPLATDASPARQAAPDAEGRPAAATSGDAHGGGAPGGDAPVDASHATMSLEQVPQGLVVGSPAHELFGGPRSPFASLEDIAQATQGCQLCALHRTARQAVPGAGNPHAELVCVGEAPGANEDEQGVPFVGPAGQLLTRILGAIQLSRDDVFICNVLKHRPPGNRNPLPDEVAACSPYLVRQIELLAPKVIIALGTFAAQTLLQTREPIGKLRGKIHRYYGVPLIVTYHPAALLRNPSWKRPTWEDVQLARRLLDRARGT